MVRAWKVMIVGGLLLATALLLSGCAPGNERFYSEPAGFWAGLWHGFICIFTFIVSLFTDDVRMYETSNVGAWYDFGFLLGAAIMLGGSGRRARRRWRGRRAAAEMDRDEIRRRVESKVRQGIHRWLEESEYKEAEWKDIEDELDDIIKRELRD